MAFPSPPGRPAPAPAQPASSCWRPGFARRVRIVVEQRSRVGKFRAGESSCQAHYQGWFLATKSPCTDLHGQIVGRGGWVPIDVTEERVNSAGGQLLVPQRDHGLNARRSAGRKPGGRGCEHRKGKGDERIESRLESVYFEEHTLSMQQQRQVVNA